MSGLLTYSPADILQRLMVQEGQATDPSDGDSWPVYVSSEPDTPDNCLTLYDTTGTADSKMLDGVVHENYGIQIRLRCAAFSVGYAKLAEIQNWLDQSLHRLEIEVSSTTFMVHSFARTGTINSIGRDTGNSNRRILTLNGTVTITS